MAVTIGCVANVYNEVNALPGWLEEHTSFFDDVRIYHAGPGGVWSNDGTMELLKKWKIPVAHGSIDEGFGAVRTKAVRSSPCDFVMILDADERFHRFVPTLHCSGQSTPHSEVDAILQTYDFRDLKTMIPNWENLKRLGANLTVQIGEPYDQFAYLRSVLAEHTTVDAVVMYRRHWHDFTWKKPTQNWHADPDWQMRLLKNVDSVYFDPGIKMHERLHAQNPWRPQDNRGPYYDHYHFTFKEMELEQRAYDIAIYDSIHAGRTPPTLEEFEAKK